MKKNVLVVHELYGGQGGAEALVLAVAQKLEASYVFSLFYDREKNPSADWEKTFSKTAQCSFHTATKAQIQKALSSLSFDLILVHKCTSSSVLEALQAYNAPVIHWEHDHEMWCMRGYRYSPFTRKICRKKMGFPCLVPCCAFIKRDRSSPFGVRYASFLQQQRLTKIDQKCNLFIVCSEYMKEEMLIQGYPKDAICVVPYVPEKCDPIHNIPDGQTVVFMGQIVRGKGVDVLLQAFSTLMQPRKLVIIGTGSHEEACKQTVQSLGMQEYVHFTGHLSFTEMKPYLERATCVVVPSMWPEPFGLVGVEALRLGIPVVGFDAGAISEWLHNGENGLLVPVSDTKALSAALTRILSNSELQQQLKRGAFSVAQQYNEKKSISFLSDIFATIM